MLSRVSSLVAGYMSQPLKRQAAPGAALRGLSVTLRPGDVLLTDGRTRAAALVRRVTRSTWAHVSMYVGPMEIGEDPRCIVEADIAAGVRAVRLSELAGQRVRVLRAAFIEDDERLRLAEWVVGRIGDAYDMALAWSLAVRLLRLSVPFEMRRVPGGLAEGTRRFICSSLLAQAFLLVGYEVSTSQRYVTPRDFDHATGFEVVGQ
jgi:hypothetical protein